MDGYFAGYVSVAVVLPAAAVEAEVVGQEWTSLCAA
jgi:hypothetical protein